LRPIISVDSLISFPGPKAIHLRVFPLHDEDTPSQGKPMDNDNVITYEPFVRLEYYSCHIET
jgi:hypothetical protein